MSNRSRPMPYDWMVKHTPQEEWIRGQGVFLWLAFFFPEIGAGVYFVSLFMNFPQGWLFGWLFALVLGGLFHLLFLGKRERALRMLAKPGCSELSRGLWVILLFTVVGFCQVAPSVVSALPWTGSTLAFKVIMGIICILMITHGFLTMNW